MKVKYIVVQLVILSMFFCKEMVAQQNYMVTYEFIDKDNVSLESRLIINENESVFKILDDRESGFVYLENGDPSHSVVNDELATFLYTNHEYSYIRIPYPESRKGTAYKLNKDTLDWKLTGASKRINQYNCQEALVEVNGRNYTVWFTLDIPVIYGPLKLDGLPGLVVEAKESKGYCTVKLLKIEHLSTDTLFKTAKGFFKENNVMNYEEYQKFMNKCVVESKIKKSQKIAEIMAASGGTVNIDLENGEYFFTRMLIDIPEGTIEELEKISLY
ncbi:GLPGLI family protein [uncultured Aquimarina sp.]|uniref:GLPGLI family protein n=1 Tax=uncultured Aquimarina sp. TaxID=575652 RepID=UPI00261B74AE|nr:GLPGLI family protein [uncultured Aquimarina sp.]